MNVSCLLIENHTVRVIAVIFCRASAIHLTGTKLFFSTYTFSVTFHTAIHLEKLEYEFLRQHIHVHVYCTYVRRYITFQALKTYHRQKQR